MERPTVRPVLVIAGPTGVGKSSLAHAVAQTVGGEIVSADSRQVYRGMTIGTAKPSPDQQAEVPYHCLDVLDPGERWSAGRFMEVATAAITAIQSGGHPAIVAGGSTLYVHALVEGLSDLPSVSPQMEAALLDQIGQPGGASALFAELTVADPAAAATLDPTKTHRLVRWVGLLRETGMRPSDAWAEGLPPIPTTLVVLTRPREALYARIDARVHQMIEAGLLAEVERLLRTSPASRATLEATIGYRELLPVLDSERDLDEAIRQIQRNSRRYAKRQLTWYRRYPDAIWLDAAETSAPSLFDLFRRRTEDA